MSAIADLTALVRNCATDFLDARYDMDADPGDIADQVYAAVRAEALIEGAVELERIAAEAEARVAEHYGVASGIGPGSAELVTASADTLREMAGEKSSREAIATPDETDPLIVDRFDIAMEAAPEDPPVLIVGATAADGTPVALFFDEEARSKVGGWLLPAAGSAVENSSRDAVHATPTDAQRRARLLHEIALGGRWKSGGVVRWYRVNGFTNLGVRAARFDLATLRDSGALVQHEERGVQYFTAPRGGGHR